ncbi:NFACT RNA binding domain-containing protein [Bacillota bacterium LX-D]|nr:NFACT RNA binding domain-containing protein [Bacillota bacterium LX-D]
MAFDGFVMSTVKEELTDKLLAGRIDKIYQPNADLLILHIRQRSGNYKLVISTHAYNCRIHLTSVNFPNPLNPPIFCMVLRKHLEGGKIIALQQQNLERQLIITIEALDELGQLKAKQLVIEIMGKHSNVILLDKEKNTIIDGMKRYTHAVSRHREVLPGRTYIEPPNQGKINPLELTEDKFRSVLLNNEYNIKVQKALVNNFSGFSSLLAREVVFRAGLEQDVVLDVIGDYDLTRLWQGLQQITTLVSTKQSKPTLYYDHEGPKDFSFLNLEHLANVAAVKFPSMSEALDAFFKEKQEKEDLAKEKHTLAKVLQKELEKNHKKRLLQEETIALAKKAEPFRIYGELLTANIYRIAKGEKVITVENFYHPENKKVQIQVNPELSPVQNAQAYFKKYNKAKAGAVKAQEQLNFTLAEINYLDSILQSVEQTTQLAELAEIKNEMIAANYISPPNLKPGKKSKIEKQQKIEPLVFTSSEGFHIYIGKNNKQNDWLTTKFAKDDDLWLHVKDLPGSHVIIKTEGKKVPDQTLLEAAHLAAYYSKGQHSSQVPVDYTLKKYVKKPAGAKPGMVIFEHNQTIYITPTEDLISKLTNNSNN